jgi:hypothetical protein
VRRQAREELKRRCCQPLHQAPSPVFVLKVFSRKSPRVSTLGAGYLEEGTNTSQAQQGRMKAFNIRRGRLTTKNTAGRDDTPGEPVVLLLATVFLILVNTPRIFSRKFPRVSTLGAGYFREEHRKPFKNGRREMKVKIVREVDLAEQSRPGSLERKSRTGRSGDMGDFKQPLIGSSCSISQFPYRMSRASKDFFLLGFARSLEAQNNNLIQDKGVTK